MLHLASSCIVLFKITRFIPSRIIRGGLEEINVFPTHSYRPIYITDY